MQIVAPLADVPVFFLATTTDFPPKTFAEFIAYAKAHPGKVRYGSAGIGSYQQINTEMLAKRAGIQLLHIPFKGGGAEIIRDLANGDIQVSWFNITNPVGMMKAGRVRPLAIAARAAAAAISGRADHRRRSGFPACGDRNGWRHSRRRRCRRRSSRCCTARSPRRRARRSCRRRFNAAAWWRRRTGSLADAKAWLRDEMATWKRDIDGLGIVVEE